MSSCRKDNELAQEQCAACQSDSPQVDAQAAAELLKQIPAWDIVSRQGVQRLERCFRFVNFADALEFSRQVGSLAEEHGHHPDMLIEWGKVTVAWWTHAIDGLHRNDFVMAARTDVLYG